MAIQIKFIRSSYIISTYVTKSKAPRTNCNNIATSHVTFEYSVLLQDYMCAQRGLRSKVPSGGQRWLISLRKSADWFESLQESRAISLETLCPGSAVSAKRMIMTTYLEQIIQKKRGPRREKTCLRAYADSEGPDQTAHARSLIRTFTVRL